MEMIWRLNLRNRISKEIPCDVGRNVAEHKNAQAPLEVPSRIPKRSDKDAAGNQPGVKNADKEPSNEYLLPCLDKGLA